MRSALLIWILVLSFAPGPAVEAQSRRPLQDRQLLSQPQPQCPGGFRAAQKQGTGDAVAFRRKRPSAVWSAFLHHFRTQYVTCTPYIKRAYLDAARKVFQPPRPADQLPWVDQGGRR